MSSAPPSLRRFHLREHDPEEARREALAALEAGELVVLPTETVYGLAAREDRPQAVQALRAFKADRTQPFSLAVASIEQLSARLLPPGIVAHRIARRWWPGPITQVLPAAQQAGLPGGQTERIGVRVPGHTWTRELLAAVGVPVLLPSANPPGAPAPLKVEDIDDSVLSAAAVLIEDGPAALGDASTVVAPGHGCLRILREGVVSRQDLRTHALGNIMVVCSGNTCRSPMAAALLGSALDQAVRHDPRLLTPRVVSAGAFTAPGRPASAHAAAAMEQRGLDISNHSTQPLSPGALADADLVLCMTRSHVAAVRELLASHPGVSAAGPDATAVELFDPEGHDVNDPFGGSPADYDACASDLGRMAGARAAALLTDPEERRT